MNPRLILTLLLLSAAIVSSNAARAQDKGSVEPKPLPPLANPNDPKLGAKELFGRKILPAAMPTRVVGFYAKGCIAGAEALPINGETWQVMRLSRNRGWRPRRMRTQAGRGYWSATCRSRAAVRCSPGTPAIRWGWTPTSG
jgi:penicillin-insensitive murein endopeptidase